MKPQQTNHSVMLASLAGIVLWGIASALTAKREPWDDSSYWVVVYPLAIAASVVLSYRYPQKPVLLTLLVFEFQFLAMAVRNGELGNLWPLGMVLFAIIALPAIFAAKLSARRSPYQVELDDQA